MDAAAHRTVELAGDRDRDRGARQQAAQFLPQRHATRPGPSSVTIDRVVIEVADDHPCRASA